VLGADREVAIVVRDDVLGLQDALQGVEFLDIFSR